MADLSGEQAKVTQPPIITPSGELASPPVGTPGIVEHTEKPHEILSKIEPDGAEIHGSIKPLVISGELPTAPSSTPIGTKLSSTTAAPNNITDLNRSQPWLREAKKRDATRAKKAA